MKAMFGLITTLLLVVFTSYPSYAALFGNDVMVQEYTYDFAVDGGAVGFIDLADAMKLPVGAIIESGYYNVQTAMTSGGAATVAIGDAASGARYKAAVAMDHADYTVNAPLALAIGVPNHVASVNEGKFGITIATAALTAGKIKFWLKVYKPKD